MAKYMMQEMNLPNEEGERLLFPRIRLEGQIGTQMIAEQVSESTAFTPGDVRGVIQSIAQQMSRWMGMGYSVKIEGIGIFTPTLALIKDKERETAESRRNARSIKVGNVRFKADKQLIQETDMACELVRTPATFRRSSAKYTPEERLERARQYLASHPYLTVANYMNLTGLKRTTAAKELIQWDKREDSGIVSSGYGKHKVYIREEKEAK